MSNKQYSVAMLAVCLVGCGPSAADIVTGTNRCGSVPVGKDLIVRLSSYDISNASDTNWVIQACHPSGSSCKPILTYSRFLPPNYNLVIGEVLEINLAGGGRIEKHNETIEIGQRTYKVHVNTISSLDEPAMGDFREKAGISRSGHLQNVCSELAQTYPDRI